MKQRVAYLIIDDKQFGDENKSLDITFDVSYMGNTLVPLDAHFTIDNLKSEDVYAITCNTALFQSRARKIEFWCGYKGNVKKLFDGQISQAVPTGQPDTSVMITAWSSIYTMGENIRVEKKKNKYIDLLEDATKECGMGLDIPIDIRKSSRMQEVVEDFSYTGSQYNYLATVIRDITGLNFVNGGITITIQNQVVCVRWTTDENTRNSIVEVNSGTGMVGIPEPTSTGVEIKMLLDVSLQAGMMINLTSEIMPLYNGKYNVYGITYRGNVRDTDFYTDLQCIRCGK